MASFDDWYSDINFDLGSGLDFPSLDFSNFDLGFDSSFNLGSLPFDFPDIFAMPTDPLALPPLDFGQFDLGALGLTGVDTFGLGNFDFGGGGPWMPRGMGPSGFDPLTEALGSQPVNMDVLPTTPVLRPENFNLGGGTGSILGNQGDQRFGLGPVGQTGLQTFGLEDLLGEGAPLGQYGFGQYPVEQTGVGTRTQQLGDLQMEELRSKIGMQRMAGLGQLGQLGVGLGRLGAELFSKRGLDPAQREALSAQAEQSRAQAEFYNQRAALLEREFELEREKTGAANEALLAQAQHFRALADAASQRSALLGNVVNQIQGQLQGEYLTPELRQLAMEFSQARIGEIRAEFERAREQVMVQADREGTNPQQRLQQLAELEQRAIADAQAKAQQQVLEYAMQRRLSMINLGQALA